MMTIEVMNKFLESFQPDPQLIKSKRTIECGLLIDPVQMKSILIWLTQKIDDYERAFGPIRPRKEQVDNRSEKQLDQ